MPRIRKYKRDKKPLPVSAPGSIAAYAEEYCQWAASRNFTERTVKTRRDDLHIFAAWCAERGLLEPTEITKPIVERYQKWLFMYRKKDGVPLSFRSQHGRLSSVRMFFKWLARQNYLLYNPAGEIEMPRVEKRLPRESFTVTEVETVLNAIDLRDGVGVRNRTMLEVFYSTGMRRMELVNLQIYDISFERGTVMIRQGKGKKDRVVPIGERALVWVRKYLDEVRPTLAPHPDSGILFLNEFGEPIGKDWLSERVRRIIRQALPARNRGGCHLFRHTCATLMLEGGADIRFIQQQLGHASLKSTEIYTQVSISKLKQIHAAAHPGARLEPHTRPEKDTAAGESPQDKITPPMV